MYLFQLLRFHHDLLHFEFHAYLYFLSPVSSTILTVCSFQHYMLQNKTNLHSIHTTNAKYSITHIPDMPHIPDIPYIPDIPRIPNIPRIPDNPITAAPYATHVKVFCTRIRIFQTHQRLSNIRHSSLSQLVLPCHLVCHERSWCS